MPADELNAEAGVCGGSSSSESTVSSVATRKMDAAMLVTVSRLRRLLRNRLVNRNRRYFMAAARQGFRNPPILWMIHNPHGLVMIFVMKSAIL